MFRIKSCEVWLIAVLIVFVSISLSYSGVPQTLNYQGTLTNNTGEPVSGSKNITFNLYGVSTGGTAFWTDTQLVTVTNGNFSVVLGSPSKPLDTSKFTGETYIGIRVDDGLEMSPRQKLTSVAYALVSGLGGVPAGGIIMWKGAVNQIPEGWALCDGTNGTPNLKDRFIVGAGSAAYPVGPGSNINYTINLSHNHVINDHTHGINATDTNHTHNDDHIHSGTVNSNPNAEHSVDDRDDSNKRSVSDNDHTHGFSTNSKSAQGYGGATAWMNQNWSHSHSMGGASDRGTDGQLSTGQDIRPPYYALAFIMKL